ncbi:MAG TPA: phosphatase, partial [Pantoea septica]|nr:phosphatase [Pantoea septica]
EKGKPAPDPYLLGAEKLGLAAEKCVVVEDAPAGILSGLDARCAVIALNAPADTPRLGETLMQLRSLASLRVTPQAEGGFSLQR